MKTRIINNLTELTADGGKWITNGTVCVKSAYPVVNPETWKDSDTDALPTNDELYDAQVDKLIRERYSVSNELSILRQRDAKPKEFEMYNAYCEDCKRKVKQTS